MESNTLFFRVLNPNTSTFTGSVRLALGDQQSMILKQDGSVWSAGKTISGVWIRTGRDRLVVLRASHPTVNPRSVPRFEPWMGRRTRGPQPMNEIAIR